MNTTQSKLLKTGLSALLVAALAGGTVACQQEGPAEQAGKKMDQTATDVGNAIEDKCEKAKEAAGAKDPDC
jgi:hypothetical protein